ncbi:hypothetical protein [Pseudomonas sp. LRF_L74]|uniref:hypothetical protein n=1 Tax=Pseudomonas sp. LRF_L74 TaxID=3369422 RepID=UPI003F5FFDE5
MSALFITMASLELLRHMLNQGGEALIKLARPGDASQFLIADIRVERVEHQVVLRLSIDETTGEIKLSPGHVGYFKSAVQLIEDVANGRIETGITAEPGSTGETIRLSTCDERTLRTVCRAGGHTLLSTGIAITVHANEHQGKRTGIAVHGAGTHLASGSAQDVYLSLAEHIQQLPAA